jgi:hypothetical protein
MGHVLSGPQLVPPAWRNNLASAQMPGLFLFIDPRSLPISSEPLIFFMCRYGGVLCIIITLAKQISV